MKYLWIFTFMLSLISPALIPIGNDGLIAGDSGIKKLYIVYTNDLRGEIGRQKATFLNPEFPPQLGGGASTATLVKRMRAAAEKDGDALLLLDAGNIYARGSELGKRSQGLAVIDYMNALHYDAMTLGVNDFSAGRDALAALFKAAEFPITAVNIKDKNDPAALQNITETRIIEQTGLRIGLFGLVSRSAEIMNDSLAVSGLQFEHEIPAAQQAVDQLNKQGAQLIIALANLGMPYDAEEFYPTLLEHERQDLTKLSYVNAMELAHFVRGIDILISGRATRGYQQPWEDPVNHTLCFQNYPNGGNLGLVMIKIDAQSNTIAGYQTPNRDGSLLLLNQDQFSPDRSIALLIDSLYKAYDVNSEQVIGNSLQTYSRKMQGESPMGKIVSDAICEAATADFAFVTNSSIRGDLQIGPVTLNDVAEVYPFDEDIVLIKLQGSQLIRMFERSLSVSRKGFAIGGGELTYEKGALSKATITSFIIQNEEIQPDRFYKIATSEYLAGGNYGLDWLAALPSDCFTFTGMRISDALAEYVRKHSPLNTIYEDRLRKE
jgi:2',3'-cyclic-nucleotide 2'-phosphodiesterase (5'-nucleotidase family)